VQRALVYEGTCTGEHGIGQGKKIYLAAEAGAGIEVMRAIKQALDPFRILNPGKII
jgi:D-lactate dehydrogenase (cytochrome)